MDAGRRVADDLVSPAGGQRKRGRGEGGDRAGRAEPDRDPLATPQQPKPGGGKDIGPEPGHAAVVEKHAPRPVRWVESPDRGLHKGDLSEAAWLVSIHASHRPHLIFTPAGCTGTARAGRSRGD